MYNIMAVTNSTGNVVERYEYGDYGEPEIIDTFGASLPASAIGNPYLFNGRRYDDETGLYYYRTRYMDPAAGRFTSRDTLGIWGDESNLGNGNTYAGNNPWSGLDPFGLMKGDFSRGHMPDRKRTTGSVGKKSREIVVVGSKVKEVVRSAMKVRPLHDRVLVSPSSSSSSGSSLTVPVLKLKKKVHFPLYDSVTIKRALGGGTCEAVDWRSTSGGCARASVKGLKEKIHFPLYDSVTIKRAFGGGTCEAVDWRSASGGGSGGGGRIIVDFPSSGTSDDNGQFWFMDLKPGIHTAAIAIPNLLRARASANESSAAGGYHWQARVVNVAFGGPGGTLAVARTHFSDEESGGITFGDGIHGRAGCCGCISLFRPVRITPMPFISGPQTAVFVGGSGEEIWPDKFGRVKVRFPWLTKASKDMILKGKKILQN
jgi:RHS repeat-associated protein